jgi:Flp pilus assembly pilin Flp
VGEDPVIEEIQEVPAAEQQDRERGQSLIEYTILLTWTCLAMIAIIHGAGQATKGAWATANNDLTQANVTAK